MIRTICVIALVLALAPSSPAQTDLATEDDKVLYALGLAVSDSLSSFALTEAELEIVKAGFTDGSLGREPKVDLETYRPKIGEFQQARAVVIKEAEEKRGQEYLDKIAAEKDVKKKGSGLLIETLTVGEGKSPGPTAQVRVHYTGKLIDGTVFDSSVERGTPSTFGLNRVIPCWTEGLQFMKEGGKSRLYCPAKIAYGERGSPPKIPPGATLVFDVELLEVLE